MNQIIMYFKKYSFLLVSIISLLSCNKAITQLPCSYTIERIVAGSPTTKAVYISYEDYLFEITTKLNIFSSMKATDSFSVVDKITYDSLNVNVFEKGKAIYHIFYRFADTATLQEMDSVTHYFDNKDVYQSKFFDKQCIDTTMYKEKYYCYDSSFVSDGNKIRIKNYFLDKPLNSLYNFYTDYRTPNNLNYAGAIIYANNIKEVEMLITDIQPLKEKDVKICETIIKKLHHINKGNK